MTPERNNPMEMNHDGCNVAVGGLVTNLEGGMTTEIARKLIADALPGLDVDTFNRVIGPLTELVMRVDKEAREQK